MFHYRAKGRAVPSFIDPLARDYRWDTFWRRQTCVSAGFVQLRSHRVFQVVRDYPIIPYSSSAKEAIGRRRVILTRNLTHSLTRSTFSPRAQHAAQPRYNLHYSLI